MNVKDYAAGVVRALRATEVAAEALAELAPDLDDGVDVWAAWRGTALDVWAAWLDMALDVEVHGVPRGGMWDVTDVVVLLTVGGPDCRVVWGGTEWVEVRCVWGSDVCTRAVCLPLLASVLDGYAEAVSSR